MSWEWRSFMQLDGITKEALSKEEFFTLREKKGIESRTDLYLFVPSFKSDKIADYGIKFRDVKENSEGVFESKRLELKIHYSRDKTGCEIWNKVLSQNLAKKCQLLKIISQIADSSLEETKSGDNNVTGYTIYYKNIVKALEEVFLPLKFSKKGPEEDYFQEAISELKTCTSMTFYFVPKKRVQSASTSGLATVEKVFGSCVKLEAKSLEDQINCTPTKICYFRSICIESDESIKSDDIAEMQKKQEDYKETIVAGYPEFLLQL